jgi:hypothetical protein
MTHTQLRPEPPQPIHLEIGGELFCEHALRSWHFPP